MIFFKDDWKYYPGAIVDLDTKNTSWVRYAALLDKMGVENNVFHLSLFDKDLVGVDPHDPNLDDQMRIKIIREVKNNVWYTLREVLRTQSIGSSGGDHYSLTRLNAPASWLTLLNISTFIMAGRQSGKSFCIEVLEVILNDIYGRNLPIDVIVNNSRLKRSTTDKKIQLRRGIPEYISYRNNNGMNRDKENTDVIDCKQLGNKIRTAIASDKVELAQMLGRGLSGPARRIDEGPHCRNIHISMGIAEMSGVAAIEQAIRNGTPYYTTITTTPGDISTEEGAFMHNIQSNAMVWTEKLYDCKNHQDLLKTITINTAGRSKFVNITMQFQHLGRNNDWLAAEIIRTEATPEDVQKDFLLQWGKGGLRSPLEKVTIERIADKLVDPTETVIDKMNYVINYYYEGSDIDTFIATHPCILSLDPSELAGQDGNGLTLVNIKDMSPILTSAPCDGNIYGFSEWIFDFLIKHPTVPFIIERKSTGVTIIDNLIAMFVKAGINPLKRIIGRWQNDEALNKRFGADLHSNVAKLTIDEYSLFKTHLGVSTNGTIRKNIYEEDFMDLTQSYAEKIRDRSIAKQMFELIYRDGRIDHPSKGHDDLVVSWLMVGYILKRYTNLRYYGIDVSKALTEGWRDPSKKKTETHDSRSVAEIQADNYLAEYNKQQLDILINRYSEESDGYALKILESQITTLYNKLTDTVTISQNLSGLVEGIKQQQIDTRILRNLNKRNFFSNLFR